MRIMVAVFLGALSVFSMSSRGSAAPAYDWSGVYAGVGTGYALGSRSWHYDFGTEPNPNPQNLSGVVFSAHAAAQAQLGAVVLGVEAQALATADLTVSATCPYAIYSCTFSMPGPVVTLAPRAGFAVGNLMAYGTAGYAGASMTTTATYVSTGALLEEGSAWHNGWVAGAGFDWAASPNLVFGIQYLHVALDTTEHVITANPGENHAVSAAFDSLTARMSFALH